MWREMREPQQAAGAPALRQIGAFYRSPLSPRALTALALRRGTRSLTVLLSDMGFVADFNGGPSFREVP